MGMCLDHQRDYQTWHCRGKAKPVLVMALHSYSQTSCHQIKVVAQWHGAWAPCLHTACPAFKSSLFQEFVAHHGAGVHVISTEGKVNDYKHFVTASVDIQQWQQCARPRGPAGSWQSMFYVALWAQTMQMYSKDVLEANWLELNLPRCSWICLLESLAWKLAGTDESNQSWL